jgi:CRISPR-associated protein Csd1
MRLEPPDPQGTPALWQYLRETAVLGKSENVPPNLAGDWMRAILTGGNYPLTLLSTILVRIRAADIEARPKLADVRQQVENDWRAQTLTQRQARAYQTLLDGYTVKIAKP